MKKSRDKKVLEEIVMQDDEKFEILQELREIVFVQWPQVIEKNDV